jgi:hypothetical protein
LRDTKKIKGRLCLPFLLILPVNELAKNKVTWCIWQ